MRAKPEDIQIFNGHIFQACDNLWPGYGGIGKVGDGLNEGNI